MPREQTIESPASFLEAVRNPAIDMRAQYMDDPEALMELLDLKLPRKPLQVMKEMGLYDEERDGPITPGLRDMVLEVCSGEVESAAAVGPRGGGKSQGVSFIEFFLVFMKMYDALNLGGSELQADQVYKYLVQYIETDPFWRSLVIGESMRSETHTVDSAWIRVLTASQKSVRSPHAGGRKPRTARHPNGRMAGGILVIDEEAEADEDIVDAALPTINTARPSVNVRCSTFHNAEGSFADLIADHVEMGYKLYRWDIFDIMERCECGPDGCESSEKCFREDHTEKFIDPETGEEKEKVVHKAYCGGRARYAEGWLPLSEAEKLWRRMKRSHSRWEVEAMGSRPSTKGHVIKDHVKWASNKVTSTGAQLYVPGGPIEICVDWGTVAAGISVWQQQFTGHACLYAEEMKEAGQAQIFGKILELYDLFPECQTVAADIGGGGNYLNKSLREEYGINVRDVNFQTEKEAAAAAWNALNEAEQLMVPGEFVDFHKQVQNWKRSKKSQRIEKGNDHICDSGICYFSKFIDEMGLSHVRVPPATMNTATETSLEAMMRRGDHNEVPVELSGPGRIAMAVAVGRRKR